MSQKEQTILIVKRDNSRYNVLNLASFDEQELAAEGLSLIRREREGVQRNIHSVQFNTVLFRKSH